MAYSVDLDQEQSDLGLHCLHMLFVRKAGVQNFQDNHYNNTATTLTVTILRAFSTDNKLKIFFLFFPENRI